MDKREQYLQAEADVTEVWNSIQDNPALHNDLHMRERHERLAARRDTLRNELEFVVSCDEFITPSKKYDQAFGLLQEIERQGLCHKQHKIFPA